MRASLCVKRSLDSERPGAVKIEEVVGQNLARLRNRWGWSQSELGEAIGQIQSKAWSRQTVSAAEAGSRAFTVADVVTLAVVLQVPFDTLVLLPPEAGQVLVGDHTFRRDELSPLAWQSESTSMTIEDVRETMSALSIHLRDLEDKAYEIQQITDRLTTVSTLAILQKALESKGVDRPDDHFGLLGRSERLPYSSKKGQSK